LHFLLNHTVGDPHTFGAVLRQRLQAVGFFVHLRNGPAGRAEKTHTL
jgi:hypothetical protein